MKLTDLRAYVRRQTETTEGELPNVTIDAFLREAFNRTIAMENQWPFYEKTWQLTQVNGTSQITLPGDANPPAFTGLYHQTDKYRVELMAHSQALEFYGGMLAGTAAPYEAFSVWSGKIHLWPEVVIATNQPWNLVGFRKPADWLAQGAEAEPDCDERLHMPLCHYAIALAYAQQEDEQLEGQYMKRYEIDVMAARSAIMEPAQDRPLIMGPHRFSRIQPHFRRPRAIVNLP